MGRLWLGSRFRKGEKPMSSNKTVLSLESCDPFRNSIFTLLMKIKNLANGEEIGNITKKKKNRMRTFLSSVIEDSSGS